MAPRIGVWWDMLKVGLPAGLEFALIFLYVLLVYGIIRDFGPAAQAGYRIGARVMQALFLPVVALSSRSVRLLVRTSAVSRRSSSANSDRCHRARFADHVGRNDAAHFFPARFAFSREPGVNRTARNISALPLELRRRGDCFSSSSIFQGLGTRSHRS